MGDILSQSEIDELLQALSAGEIDVRQIQTKTEERKIKNHDFRKPNKFAKDHLRTLQIIHENYARLITNFLSGYLRTLVQVEVISVEELTYYEFNNSISNPVILCIVDFSPFAGSIILEMAPNIAFAIIDRILGGKGKSLEKVRGFTEIELAIIERVVTQLLNLMREPWEKVTQVKPRLEKLETNAQFAQIISPNEMTALVTLSTKINDVEGMMNICIPYQVVEPIVPKLSTKYWFSMREKSTTEVSKEFLEKKIEGTKIPIQVVLGRANLTVADVIELQPGDVIQLDTSLHDELKVYVGEIYKFRALPGVKDNRMAIKITAVIREEEDDG